MTNRCEEVALRHVVLSLGRLAENVEKLVEKCDDKVLGEFSRSELVNSC